MLNGMFGLDPTFCLILVPYDVLNYDIFIIVFSVFVLFHKYFKQREKQNQTQLLVLIIRY